AEWLLETGRTYRWAFETSTALTTPQRAFAPVSARSPLRASAGPQDAVFAAGALLRGFRTGLSGRQVEGRGRGCGCDESVRAAGLAMRADPRTVRRLLLEALTAAHEARRRQRAESRDVSA